MFVELIKIRLANINRTQVGVYQLEDTAFILYLCLPMISAIFARIIEPSFAVGAAIIITFLPLVFAHLKRKVVWDFGDYMSF